MTTRGHCFSVERKVFVSFRKKSAINPRDIYLAFEQKAVVALAARWSSKLSRLVRCGYVVSCSFGVDLEALFKSRKATHAGCRPQKALARALVRGESLPTILDCI